MPYDEVMHKFKRGLLHSGSGKKVANRKQAIAIMLSEKGKAQSGKKEYKSHKGIGPSEAVSKEIVEKIPRRKRSMFMKKK